MKMRMAAFSALLGLTAASCNETTAPPERAPTAVLPEGLSGATASSPNVVISGPGLPPETRGSPTAPSIVNATPTAPPAAPKNETVVAPKDAQWTIFCTVVGGPEHAQRARALKNDLISRTRADHHADWYVIHGDTESTIYYGFYSDIERGTKEGPRAQADRAYLQALADSTGEHPLQLCHFLRLDSGEAEDIPQWNLANIARSQDKYWTLQVAAFTADKERRQAAVDAVKGWRKEGAEAYYYHGEAVSSVVIGIWPYSAVREQTGGRAIDGTAGTVDPTQPILVSDVPISHRMQQPETADGRKIKTMAPVLEIIDPSLLAATRRFPVHAINGYYIERNVKNPTSGRPEKIRDRSVLVLVPEAKASTIAAPRIDDPNTAWLNSGANLNQQGLAQPRTQTPLPGVGRLRSSGD